MKTIIISFVIVFCSYLINYLLNIILAQWFGVKVYGDYTTVIYSLQVFGMVLLTGLDFAMMKFLPTYISTQDWASTSGYLHFSFRVLFRNSVIVFIAGVIVAVILYFLDKMQLFQFSEHHPTFLFLWGVPCVVFTIFLGKYLRSTQQVVLSLFSLNLAQPILMLLLFTLAWFSGYSFNLFEAIFIYLLTLLLVLASQFAVSYSKIFSTLLLPVTPSGENKKWLKTAIELLVINFLTFNMLAITIILSRIYDPVKEDAGILSAVFTICSTMWLIYTAVNMVISPLIGPAMVKQDKPRLKFLMRMGNLSMFGISLIILAIYVFYGKVLLSHFGSDFVAKGYFPLLILAGVFLFTLSFGSFPKLIQYSRKRKLLLKITAFLLAAYIVLVSIATHYFSLTGTIIVFVSVQITITLIYIVMAWQFFREE